MYELTFLLNDESELEPMQKLVAAANGKVVKETKWGSRKLTYPIKKQTSAFYYTWDLEIDANQVSELKKKLNFNEKLLRYLLLKAETE